MSLTGGPVAILANCTVIHEMTEQASPCPHVQVLLDTMVERDYYKQVFESTDGGNESLPRENGLALPSTPVRSPSVNTELLDLKKKSRLTQEQLYVSQFQFISVTNTLSISLSFSSFLLSAASLPPSLFHLLPSLPPSLSSSIPCISGTTSLSS